MRGVHPEGAMPGAVMTAGPDRGVGGSRLLLLLTTMTAVAVAAVVGVAAVRSPIMAGAGVAGIALVVVAVQNLSVGLALFTTLTFFEAAPGFGGGYKLIGIPLLASWLVVLATRRWKPLLLNEHPVLSFAGLALALLAGASVLWAEDRGMAKSGALSLVQMLLLLPLVYTAIRDYGDLRLFARAFIAGAVLTTLLGLAGVDGAAQESGGRFGGYVGNPNNLAALILPAIALSGFMLGGSRRARERLLLACCGIFLVVALFLTQSRGALVGLGAMCIAAVVFAGPMRRRVLRTIVVAGVAALLYLAMFGAPSGFRHVETFSAANSTGRVDLWQIGTQMFENHPFRGIGLNNFTAVAPRYLERAVDVQASDLVLEKTAPLHNTYLNMFVDLGFAGGTLFLVLVGGVLAIGIDATRAIARTGAREPELLARGLLIGTFGMLTAYFFFSAQYEKQLWLVLGALLALTTVAKGLRRHRAAEPDGGGGQAEASLRA